MGKKVIPSSRGITPRQQVVLVAIRSIIREKGYPPTIRELQAYFGLRSSNTISDHLRALRRKGYLERADTPTSRGIRPTEPPVDLELVRSRDPRFVFLPPRRCECGAPVHFGPWCLGCGKYKPLRFD